MDTLLQSKVNIEVGFNVTGWEQGNKGNILLTNIEMVNEGSDLI